MFRTDDNYNLYYDGAISRDQETAFQTLIAEHQLSPEFTELLKRHYNFSIKNSYHDHKKLLWIFYKVFGSFAITIFSAEEEHPHGCEYQSRVDYFIDENGNYEYEMKNSLFKYDNYEMSDECKERIEKGSAGYEKDCKVRGYIEEMQLEPFVKSLAAGLEK
ncbi:MAG: hypothetical protein JSV14_13325 [Deltaproteobacteria bacterium]|nr:MAG: hypothetical protein JSV14_13325 [Deltaproteobacteria bacterium]